MCELSSEGRQEEGKKRGGGKEICTQKHTYLSLSEQTLTSAKTASNFSCSSNEALMCAVSVLYVHGPSLHSQCTSCRRMIATVDSSS